MMKTMIESAQFPSQKKTKLTASVTNGLHLSCHTSVQILIKSPDVTQLAAMSTNRTH